MPLSDELLLGFYERGEPDVQGRTHASILCWSDAVLEAVHDYIQWLFPLPEVSGANPSAPLMTPRVRQAFHHSAEMRGRLRAAWLRMLSFYGLCAEADGGVREGENFEARAREWVTPGNHNHLRLTRILRSLHLAGLEEESQATFEALVLIYRREQGKARPGITATTLRYWESARQG